MLISKIEACVLEDGDKKEGSKFKKSWTSTCPTFSKTRYGKTSREKIRMVRALLPDTPKTPQFQPGLQFFHFLLYFQFFQVFIVFWPYADERSQMV